MTPSIQTLRNETTFLMHVTGDGLPEDRFAVQFFQSKANGDIVPVHPEETPGKGKPRPSIMTLEKVRALRPGRDGIIIATGIDDRKCRLQAWGIRASGIGYDRRVK